MSLILDHINGVARRQPAREPPDRLPELRRHARHALRAQPPARRDRVPTCGARRSAEEHARQRYCSQRCWHASRAAFARACHERRKVERPSYEQLLADLARAELGRRRREVRRLRQRRAQVGAALRGRAGRATRPRASRPPTLSASRHRYARADAHRRRRRGRRPARPRDGRARRRSVMPLGEVRAGMQCTGYSVVRGTDVAAFDVEVIDVVDDRRRGDRAADPRRGRPAPAVDETGHRARASPARRSTAPTPQGTPRNDRRDLRVDRRVRRQGRAGDADRGDPRQPGRRAARATAGATRRCGARRAGRSPRR